MDGVEFLQKMSARLPDREEDLVSFESKEVAQNLLTLSLRVSPGGLK